MKVRADTENMQAYELYLKARENFIARRDLSETTGMFQRVVQLDPKFARGWEGLAAVSSVAPSWGTGDRDYFALSQQAADRALELDPSLSMPWAALADCRQQPCPRLGAQPRAHSTGRLPPIQGTQRPCSGAALSGPSWASSIVPSQT